MKIKVPDHIETILRRAAASNCSISRLVPLIWLFSSALELEGIHPYHAGLLRRKYRHDRRPGMPIEPIWSFYPTPTKIGCRKPSDSSASAMS